MKLRDWTSREYLALGAAGVTVTLLAGGGWVLQSRRQAAADAPDTFVLPAQGDGSGGDGAAPAGEDGEPAAPQPSATPAPEKLTVYVTGAVKRPGVYLLKPGTRIYQAIHAAGGFKPNARQDALNIADEVRDADQINVPTKEAFVAATGRSPGSPAPRSRGGTSSAGPPPTEVAFAPLPSARRPASVPPPSRATPFATVIPGSAGADADEPRETGRIVGVPPVPVVGTVPAGGGTAGPSSGVSDEPAALGGGPDTPARSASASSSEKLRNPGDGTVNLNTATSAELQKLPGVGPSTAEKILAYRQQIGRFTDKAQIQDVKGIGEKKYAKMEPFLRVE